MPNGDQNPQVPQPSAPSAPKPPEQVGLRVSLIPVDEYAKRDPASGFRLFLIVVIVFAVLIGGAAAFLGVKAYSGLQEVAKIDAQTADMTKQSTDLEASITEAKAMQSRLKALGTLLGQHRTGLKILTFLEKHTLPDVAYSSLSVGENGAVNLAASTSSYESYAAQIGEMRAQKELKSVATSGVSPKYDDKNNLLGVDFNFALVFDESLFLGSVVSNK
jgi:hypothetical protein